jgi:hypothetical protein
MFRTISHRVAPFNHFFLEVVLECNWTNGDSLLTTSANHIGDGDDGGENPRGSNSFIMKSCPLGRKVVVVLFEISEYSAGKRTKSGMVFCEKSVVMHKI